MDTQNNAGKTVPAVAQYSYGLYSIDYMHLATGWFVAFQGESLQRQPFTLSRK